jgi:hypothetical protein
MISLDACAVFLITPPPKKKDENLEEAVASAFGKPRMIPSLHSANLG